MATAVHTGPIDTARVTDRRTLRFHSLDEMLVEAERLAAAERAGKLRRTGNWTVGQALGHLAGWMNVAFDGYPPDMPSPPWFIKIVLRFMKNSYLNKGMPVGVRIPRVEGGTKFNEVLGADEGLARLRSAAARLKRSAPTEANTVFGPMTHEETIKLNLRHAELHLSFFHPT